MNNERVAKELLKLAKGLVGEDGRLKINSGGVKGLAAYSFSSVDGGVRIRSGVSNTGVTYKGMPFNFSILLVFSDHFGRWMLARETDNPLVQYSGTVDKATREETKRIVSAVADSWEQHASRKPEKYVMEEW